MMELIEVTPREYFDSFDKTTHAYNSEAFLTLNAHKCEIIHYIIVSKNGKPRMRIALGEREDRLLSPFSAPFGGPDFSKTPDVETASEVMTLLAGYARQAGKQLVITLPPAFYAPELVEPMACHLLNDKQFTIQAEYNYHYPLAQVADYHEHLSRAAKKNLNQALRHDYKFLPISPSDIDGVKRAYEVIRLNRQHKGYPLWMSLQDVMDTIIFMPAEFFLLTLDGRDVAAAQVYYPARGIAQVIYWGDAPGYSEYRPMNMLAFRLNGYMAGKVGTLDIGPSSSDGIPNAGLCSFKESIGCILTPKLRVIC